MVKRKFQFVVPLGKKSAQEEHAQEEPDTEETENDIEELGEADNQFF